MKLQSEEIRRLPGFLFFVALLGKRTTISLSMQGGTYE
jgi:hypothetical protein